MKKIVFVTPFSHAFLAYPLQKHRKALKKAGFFLKVTQRLPKNIDEYSFAIITRAFFVKCARNRNLTEGPHDLIKRTADKLHSKGVKVIFFDDRDSTASAFFQVLPYVDVFLKRQHLKNLETYIDTEYAKTHSGWLVSAKPRSFAVARADQLHKIRLAWNVGFEDFGPWRKAAKIASWYGLTWSSSRAEPSLDRRIITGFRGALGGSRRKHRQEAIDSIERCSIGETRTRGRVSRRKYLKEMRDSLTAVSPFGFGEPCYRDFEAILAGAVLVKPDMSHLETYPDVYKPYSTYVPVRWDFEDLEETLIDLLSDRNVLLEISSAAQVQYLDQINSSHNFTRFFANILDAASTISDPIGDAQ